MDMSDNESPQDHNDKNGDVYVRMDISDCDLSQKQEVVAPGSIVTQSNESSGKFSGLISWLKKSMSVWFSAKETADDSTEAKNYRCSRPLKRESNGSPIEDETKIESSGVFSGYINWVKKTVSGWFSPKENLFELTDANELSSSYSRFSGNYTELSPEPVGSSWWSRLVGLFKFH